MYDFLLNDSMYIRLENPRMQGGYKPMELIKSAALPVETLHSRSLTQFLDDSAIPYHFEYTENETLASYLTGPNAGANSSPKAVTAVVTLHVYTENDAFQIRLFNGMEPLVPNWREIFRVMGETNSYNQDIYERLTGRK